MSKIKCVRGAEYGYGLEIGVEYECLGTFYTMGQIYAKVIIDGKEKMMADWHFEHGEEA